MHVRVDYSQVQKSSVASSDTDGSGFTDDGYTVPIFVPLSEVQDLLASYDADTGSSPSAQDSRMLARVVLDALVRKINEEGP